MSITIVRLDEHSLHLLEHVAEDVFDEPVDSTRARALVALSNHILMLAVAEDRVVGQALGMIHHHPDKVTELYVDDLGVAPNWQRQGIATRLVQALMAEGRPYGAMEVWVATEPENANARAFYDSLGLVSREAIVFEGKT